MSTTVPAALVKELREKTGAGMMDCKRALEEAGGDLEAATASLRTKGLADAAKRAGRAANEGLVDSYIHAGGRVGVLVEVNCETDFVARTDDFDAFVHDVALHIAALKPLFLSAEDVPEDYIASERAIYEAQAEDVPEHARGQGRGGQARQAPALDLPARAGVRARPGREDAADGRAAPCGDRRQGGGERHHPAIRPLRAWPVAPSPATMPAPLPGAGRSSDGWC